MGTTPQEISRTIKIQFSHWAAQASSAAAASRLDVYKRQARYLLQTHDADCKRPCATLFSGFSYFGKLLGLYWLLALKVFLWALIPIGVVVFGMVLIGLLAIAGMGWFSLAFLPLVVVAMLAASIPAICAEYRYSMAYFLMVENPDLGVSECIQCSINPVSYTHLDVYKRQVSRHGESAVAPFIG